MAEKPISYATSDRGLLGRLSTYCGRHNAVARVGVGQGAVMDWARNLTYVTGTVDQDLLARNEYLAAEKLVG